MHRAPPFVFGPGLAFEQHDVKRLRAADRALNQTGAFVWLSLRCVSEMTTLRIALV